MGRKILTNSITQRDLDLDLLTLISSHTWSNGQPLHQVWRSYTYLFL